MTAGIDRGMTMAKRITTCAMAIAIASMLAACGDGGSSADTPGDGGDAAAGAPAASETAANGAASATAAATSAPPAETLLMAPDWMPADWDRNAFRGDAYSPGTGFDLQPELVHDLRQEMQLTAPFTIWAVAHDTLIDERFEPVWVWWTALRSCERGIRMTEDLAGEFGDRARGKAALTTAREELKAYAATQPAEITLHVIANLGKWNEATGNFPLVTAVHHGATSIDAREVEKLGQISVPGAELQLGSDSRGEWTLRQARASISDVACVSADGQQLYRFSRQSQWYVVFGGAERGMGGLVNYTSAAQVPAPNMTRDAAAAFSQRNPERKVMVSITFGPGEPGFVVGVDHSAVRGVLRKAEVIDAIDGSVLATKTY